MDRLLKICKYYVKAGDTHERRIIVMTDKIRIEVECPQCKGTGVYTEDWSSLGHNLNDLWHICSSCKGSAKVVLEYTPYTERKIMTGVQGVHLLKESGEPNWLKEISYEEFVQRNEFLEAKGGIFPFRITAR